jgi:hypothetical protein
VPVVTLVMKPSGTRSSPMAAVDDVLDSTSRNDLDCDTGSTAKTDPKAGE